jgi:hypothetical protein
MPTATAWLSVSLAEPYPPRGGQSVPGSRSGMGCRLLLQPRDKLRRNAVAVHGVKLDAAPDAPPWGKVLACLPLAPVRIQRRPVAARDIHPPPHRHTRQARPVHGGSGRAGCTAWRTCAAVRASHGRPAPVLEPALGPASDGTGCERCTARGAGRDSTGRRPARGRRDRAVRAGIAGWRGLANSTTSSGPAVGRSVTAGGSGRICGRHPHPGKDPS